MAYTKEQQQAIDQRKKNLLVAAAAGSGKTQVMVERIIKLVCEDHVAIDSMLIVTFTNAAASEMKERIHFALESRLEQDPNNIYLKRQLEVLPQATIGTMHSFCIDIIRNNFNVVSVDPGFKMGVESTISVLKSKIIDEIFEDRYEGADTGFTALVDGFGGRTDEKLKDLVLKLHSGIQAQPYPLQWLEKQVEGYNISKDTLKDSMFMISLFNQLESDVESAIKINALAIKYANYEEGPFPYISAIEDDLRLCYDLKNLIKNRKLDELIYYVNTISFQRAKSIKKSDGINETLIEKTKSLRDEFKKRLKDLGKLLPSIGIEKELEKLNTMYVILNCLSGLIKEFDEAFMNEKQKRGILDFNDLEHFALKILENDNIKIYYKNKFNYIFFDEYQDSNLVQETIIESIKSKDNLFFVGDVKQAIYRFRLSEPMLFNSRYNSYSKNSDELSEKIDLSKNFRSNKKVLDFTNFIFERLMSDALGQIDYSKKEVQLEAGMEFPSWDGGVELNIINLSKSEKKDAVNYAEEVEKEEEAEYKFIVEKIKSLIGKDIYMPKAKVTKKADFGDIAVLFRSPKGSINKLAHLLTENSVPNIVDYTETNATSVEILTLYDYLKVIDNRFQDEALLGSLTSFFGGLNLDNIIDIKIKYPNERFLYNAIDLYRENENDIIAKQLNDFFKEIESYKQKEGIYELSEFLWRIITNKGYLMYLNSLKMGNQKRHNVLGLIEKAKEYAQGESNKLFGFLLYIDKIFKDKQDKVENVLSENENAVKLMSIHKSKGLEFPIVILCDTKKKFNEQEYKEDIILHNNIGIGSRYIDIENNFNTSTLPRNVIIAEKKQEAISEEVRILYVAFTRAINMLIIVGATKNLEASVKKAKKGRDSSLLRKINNYFEWIITVLWNHKAFNGLRDIFDEELFEFEIESNPLDLSVNLISEEEISYKSEKRFEREKISRLKLNSMIEDAMSKAEAFDINEKIFKPIEIQQIKYSVTEIAKSQSEEDAPKYKKNRLHKTPKSLQGVKKLNPMEKGTLMHSVLEHLDLKASYQLQDIKDEIQIMVNQEKLTAIEADYIDISQIYELVVSPIGQRMREAVKIHKEETFLLKYQDKIIDGVIDCYFIEKDGNIILLDYKTDKEIRAKLYVKQLELYKIALEKQYKRQVKEAYIYWFNHKEFTKINVKE